MIPSGAPSVIFSTPAATATSQAPAATASAAARTAAPPEAHAASIFNASTGSRPAASATRVATFSWPLTHPPSMLPT